MQNAPSHASSSYEAMTTFNLTAGQQHKGSHRDAPIRNLADQIHAAER